MVLVFFLCVNVCLQGLVCAGLADMARPAEKLSTAQSAVLMATGELMSIFYVPYRTFGIFVLFYISLFNGIC